MTSTTWACALGAPAFFLWGAWTFLVANGFVYLAAQR